MLSGRARILGPALAVALVAATLGGATIAQGSSAGQVSLTDARSDHTATLLPDERVLLAGGVEEGVALQTIEVVDPAAASVEMLGSLLSARNDHTATLLSDGHILFAGGRADGTALGSAELFDPETGASADVGPMRWARAGHAAALLNDGRVLLVGGTAKGRPVARAELFDPASGTFVPAAKAKAVHRTATASMLPNGQVLVAGAATGKKAPAAELYDPVKDKWFAVKKAPGITGHVATKLRDGRVLLTGGSARKTQLFGLAKGKFAQAPALAAPRTGHTATPLLLGEVLIVGGEEDGQEVAAVELFDIESDTFTTIGRLMLPRTGHSVTALPDGGALVAGGTWAELALADLLYLDPDTYELEPLGGVSEFMEPAPDARTKADVTAELGAPDAFLILYPEPTSGLPSLETWTWFDSGTELTFEDEALVAEEMVEPMDDIVATPYDPGAFRAGMQLDAVAAAAGLEDYVGGPMDEADTTELWFAEQLAWGLKDGALVYVEGLALGADSASEEAE